MNAKIFEYLKTDKSYDGAVRLYHEFGDNQSFKQNLNVRKENDDLKAQLMYEIQQLSGLDKADFDNILSQPLVKVTDFEPLPELLLIDIPFEIKRTIKMREEFPFLNDADCPNELKILVADRITAYHNYVNDHEKLFEAASDEELQELAASVVENYIDNQEIWDELNYYKENGQIHGKCQIFDWKMREDEIRALLPADLIKLRDQLKNNIPRTKKLILDEPKHASLADRKISLKQKEKEFKLVNQLLGFKEEEKKVTKKKNG